MGLLALCNNVKYAVRFHFQLLKKYQVILVIYMHRWAWSDWASRQVMWQNSGSNPLKINQRPPGKAEIYLLEWVEKKNFFAPCIFSRIVLSIQNTCSQIKLKLVAHSCSQMLQKIFSRSQKLFTETPPKIKYQNGVVC